MLRTARTKQKGKYSRKILAGQTGDKDLISLLHKDVRDTAGKRDTYFKRKTGILCPNINKEKKNY